MNNPSIIYMGTPDFAVAPLKALVENGYTVKAVVTVADKPAGRGQKLRMSAVKQYAVSQGINVLQPLKLKSEEFLNALKSLNADLFIVIAFRMLPKEVWKMPRLGTFNIHGSLLPNYRGAAPINWAIINGETKTGVTSFFINEEIDSGKIIDSLSVEINKDDNAGTLHDKLMHLAAELVIQTTELIANGNVELKTQTLTGNEKPAPKIFKGDCEIDWSRPIQDILNFVRGLSPYPVAWTPVFEDGKDKGQMRILQMTVVHENKNDEHGILVIRDNSFQIDLAQGTFQIDFLQWPGKKKMDAKSFINGFRAEGKLSVSGNFS